MYQGVLRDEARRKAKQEERMKEMEDQSRLRQYLETKQPVSNPSTVPVPALGRPLTDAEVKLEGCQTC